MTNDFTSATFASMEKIFRLSMTICAALIPPVTSNVNIEPAPKGKYRLYRLWSGCDCSTG